MQNPREICERRVRVALEDYALTRNKQKIVEVYEQVLRRMPVLYESFDCRFHTLLAFFISIIDETLNNVEPEAETEDLQREVDEVIMRMQKFVEDGDPYWSIRPFMVKRLLTTLDNMREADQGEVMYRWFKADMGNLMMNPWLAIELSIPRPFLMTNSYELLHACWLPFTAEQTWVDLEDLFTVPIEAEQAEVIGEILSGLTEDLRQRISAKFPEMSDDEIVNTLNRWRESHMTPFMTSGMLVLLFLMYIENGGDDHPSIPHNFIINWMAFYPQPTATVKGNTVVANTLDNMWHALLNSNFAWTRPVPLKGAEATITMKINTKYTGDVIIERVFKHALDERSFSAPSVH